MSRLSHSPPLSRFSHRRVSIVKCEEDSVRKRDVDGKRERERRCKRVDFGLISRNMFHDQLKAGSDHISSIGGRKALKCKKKIVSPLKNYTFVVDNRYQVKQWHRDAGFGKHPE